MTAIEGHRYGKVNDTETDRQAADLKHRCKGSQRRTIIQNLFVLTTYNLFAYSDKNIINMKTVKTASSQHIASRCSAAARCCAGLAHAIARTRVASFGTKIADLDFIDQNRVVDALGEAFGAPHPTKHALYYSYKSRVL